MDENGILERLTLFGLTRMEATLYLCLYRQGEQTGYEAAKYTGISRSNVYSGLTALTDKGAATLAEGNTSRYAAVPVAEFCENKIRSLMEEKEYLIQNIPVMREQELGYLTITGSRNIWDKVIHMIAHAQMRIYFSASVCVIDRLEKNFEAVLKKQIKLVFITDGEPASVQLREGSICYVGAERGDNIRMITDSAYALTGEVTGSKEDTCLYTGQKNFISVFKETLRNEIKLIELSKKQK